MLLFSTGDRLEVDGSPVDVEKPLQNAVRSSPGTLAWLHDARTGEPVAVNPVHVVTLMPAATAAAEEARDATTAE